MTNAEPDSTPIGLGLKEQIQSAIIDKLKAETARIRTETDQHDEYLRTAKANARIAEINLETEEFTHKARMANDYHHHTLPLSGVIDPALVNTAISQLTTWHRTAPGCDITIYLSSPGGNITYGMMLYDFIRFMVDGGHKVTIIVLGLAASMGSVILQAGTHRVLGKEAWMMIHEASFGAGGKMGDVEDTTAWIKATQERILDIYTKRAAGKTTKAAFKAGWNRKDWWIDSDKALKMGLCDEVL